MLKTRSLAADPGDRADWMYYTLSGSCNPTPPNNAVYLQYLDQYVAKYYDGLSKATTVLAGTKPVGVQTFESSTRARPWFNSCRNTKLYGYSYPYLLLTQSWNSPTTAYYVPYMRKPIPSVNFGLLSQTETLWTAVDSASSRAWGSMQPRFHGEVSMLNFIYELKDFKHLARLIANPRESSQKFFRMVKQSKKLLKEYNVLKRFAKTADEASKVWANLWLTNAFVIEPLIADCKDIADSIQRTATAAQEEFQQRGLEEQITHYTEKLSESYVGTWGSYNNAMFFTGMHQLATYTATLQYRYDYRLRSGFDAFNRYWGLNLNAGVVWEATPFSFLVDYFAQVGNAINFNSRDPNVNLSVTQYCESILTDNNYCVGINPGHSLVRRFYSPSNRCKENYTGFTPLSGIAYTHYKRRITVPNQGFALPRIKCPSNTQAMNMLALVRGTIGIKS